MSEFKADEYNAARPKKKHRRTAKGGIPQKNPFVEMLQETSVESILPGRRTVIVLDDTNTVHEALRLLSKYQILSAPVLDFHTKRFLGFVDMLDICGFVVSLFDEVPASIITNPHLSYQKSHELLQKQIGHLMDFSTSNPVLHVKKASAIWQCIGVFQKGVHRVAVSNESEQIINLLSQSDVIRFLVPKMDQYNTIFDQTAQELGLGMLPPICILESDPTIKALRILHQRKISAIAVVNAQGVLVGNLSASDLKGAVTTDDDSGADAFGSLHLPVISFLRQGGMSLFPVVSCTRATAFSYILLRILALRVHRLWVVDDEQRPIGVVSLTDIMKILIDQKQPERTEVY